VVALLLIVVVLIMIRSSGHMERFFFPGGPDPGDPPPGVEAVMFPGSSGRQLHGWWTPAHASFSPPLGTVVHIHGNAQSVDNHHPLTNYLAGHGFNVFIFDYRGYGRSEGHLRRREDAFADARAAVAYVRGRPDVDPERLALFGHSIGGAVTLTIAPEISDLAAVVVVSPFASWQWIAANTISGHEPPGRVGRFVASILVREGVEPRHAIAGIDQCPLLIVHGDADDIVPIEHGEALLETALNAGVDARLRRIPGGDHNNLPIDLPPISDEIAAFLTAAMTPRLPPFGMEASDISGPADEGSVASETPG
jgi:dipeptidyl aminopeptidase/acylaminoacyl peptidase